MIMVPGDVYVPNPFQVVGLLRLFVKRDMNSAYTLYDVPKIAIVLSISSHSATGQSDEMVEVLFSTGARGWMSADAFRKCFIANF